MQFYPLTEQQQGYLFALYKKEQIHWSLIFYYKEQKIKPQVNSFEREVSDNLYFAESGSLHKMIKVILLLDKGSHAICVKK